MSVNVNDVILSKKVLAHDIVTIRASRGGEDIPMIVSIPKPIANILKLKLKDRMQIYTDGERIYLDKIKEPTIS